MKNLESAVGKRAQKLGQGLKMKREDLDLDYESWDARDFIFSSKYFCPICATPEDGTCQVLVDWEIEKWGSCKVLKEEGI